MKCQKLRWRIILWGTALCLTVATLCLFWQRTDIATGDAGEVQANEERGDRLATLPAEFDWDDAEEDELRNLILLLETGDEEQDDDPDGVLATLREGERFVTEGVEVEPGIFLFTTLSPVFQKKDGVDAVVVSLERTRIDLGGSVESKGGSKFHLRQGDLATLVNFRDSGQYEVHLQAAEVVNHKHVRLRVIEQLQHRGEHIDP